MHPNRDDLWRGNPQEPNFVIRRRSAVVDVIKKITTLKWNWADHVARTRDDRWTNNEDGDHKYRQISTEDEHRQNGSMT